jgi:TRAP-type mannitol/chloroaromatic compound transport system permease small subunit
MPSISFELPHWLYWAVLFLFPAFAMAMARRGRTEGYSIPLAYFIWATGGILGLHRLYLKNLWGLLFLPLFLLVLYANAEGRDARAVQSDAANVVRVAERQADRARSRLDGSDARIAEAEAALAAAEGGSFAARRAERQVEREREAAAEARERLAEAEAEIAAARPALEQASATRQWWADKAKWVFYGICALLLIDAALVPTLVRRAREKAAAEIQDAEEMEAEHRLEEIEEEEIKRDLDHVQHDRFAWIDKLSYYSGEFVSYWAVIAVFVYFYEVVARYVFNSPTNWAHEGMFLMFGMQYLIAGSYAMLTDAHVRVDIFYAEWSAMRKAVVDLLTSIFFFIFAGTLLATGWIFAMDATRVGEISFSEWAIAYWPFKWAIFVGGVLLILQGVAKLARDIRAVGAARQGA